MKTETINNTSFKGFIFREPYDLRAFDEKLKQCSDTVADSIKNYINDCANKKEKVFVSATKKRTINGEYIMYATFSNNDNFILENIHNPRKTGLTEFIKKCGELAGFPPFKETETDKKLINSYKILDLKV